MDCHGELSWVVRVALRPVTAALVGERPEGELRQTEEKWEEALLSEEQIFAQVFAIFAKGVVLHTGSESPGAPAVWLRT